jgi:hypothetical protein
MVNYDRDEYEYLEKIMLLLDEAAERILGSLARTGRSL